MSTTISGSDNFNSSTIPCDFVLVAGGGGAGAGEGGTGGDGGGGGGGGGVLAQSFSAVKGVSYPITIGAGGLGGTTTYNVNVIGQNGGNSAFGQFLAWGGGGGGGDADNQSWGQGRDGGCGGGASSVYNQGAYAGCGFPGQGFPGGNTLLSPASYRGGAGGGGAGGPGISKGTSSVGNQGGMGVYTWAGYFSGGGCGAPSGSNTVATGLQGGGSSTVYNVNPTPPAANTGCGGGAGGSTAGAVGASGKFTLRHLDTYPKATVSGTVTVTQSGGYYIYTFTGNGTIAF